jgi:hypothetical protein
VLFSLQVTCLSLSLRVYLDINLKIKRSNGMFSPKILQDCFPAMKVRPPSLDF